jgi:hypothetical protein
MRCGIFDYQVLPVRRRLIFYCHSARLLLHAIDTLRYVMVSRRSSLTV